MYTDRQSQSVQAQASATTHLPVHHHLHVLRSSKTVCRQIKECTNIARGRRGGEQLVDREGEIW